MEAYARQSVKGRGTGSPPFCCEKMWMGNVYSSTIAHVLEQGGHA